MAEIKSTLDLVMEKTSHLRLSREEKERQKIDTFKKKLSGLLLQCADETYDKNLFNEDYHALERQFDIKSKSILKNEILDKLTLEQANSRLMDLLQDFCHIDTQKLKTIISECQTAIEAAAQKRMTQIITTLEKNHHISGTSVKPNLDSDSKWNSELDRIRKKFDHLLSQEKSTLTASEY